MRQSRVPELRPTRPQDRTHDSATGPRAPTQENHSEGLDTLLDRAPREQQVQLLLAYQRSAGNAYVQRVVRQRRATRTPNRVDSPGPEQAPDETPEQDLQLAPFEPPAVTSEPPPGAVQRASNRQDSNGGILGSIRTSLDGLRSGWASLRGSAESAISGLQKRAAGVEAALGKVADGALHAIAGGWASLRNTASTLTRELETRLQSGIGAITSGANALASAVAQADANAVQRAWSVVTGAVGGLKDTVSNLGQAAVGKLAELWSGLGRQFSGVLSSIGTTARSLISGLNNAAQSVTSRIQAGWSALQRRASQMGGVAGAIASVVQALVNTIMQAAQRIWGDIQGLWNGLQQRLSGLWHGLQARAGAAWSTVTARARSAWASIGAAWATVRNAVTGKVQGMVGKFGDLWRKINGFSIARVVQGFTRAAPFIAQLRKAIADPKSVVEPIVDKLANQLRAEVPAKSQDVVQQHLDQSRGAGTGSQPAAVGVPIMRLVDLSAASMGGPVVQRATVAEQRSTETWAAVFGGTLTALKEKWQKLDLLSMLWDAVMALFWPPATLKVISTEFGDMWEEVTASARGLFAPRGGDFWSFMRDLYSNFMKLQDIPLSIGRHLTNIAASLSGYATIALMILGAVGGELAAGVITALTGGLGAGTVLLGGPGGAGVGLAAALSLGQQIFAAFLGTQLATVGKALLDLLTVDETRPEKEAAYGRAADSGIGLGIALVLTALSMIGAEIGSRALPFLRKIPIPDGIISDDLKGRARTLAGGVQEGVTGRPLQSNGRPVSDAAFDVFKRASPDRKLIFSDNPDFLERFAGFTADDQAFLNGIHTQAFDDFSRLPEATQDKFLSVSQRVYTPRTPPGAPIQPDVSFRINFRALDESRQAALMTESEIDAMANLNAMDQSYMKPDGTPKQGHSFAQHGAFRSDQEMFARAVSEGHEVSRYNSAIEQELQETRLRAIMEDPATPAGNDSAINAAGRRAIASGRVTADEILADRITNMRYLKARVDFKVVPAGHVVGTEFLPDGVTTNPVSSVSVLFELDSNGHYQVLTNYPER